jgi:malonate decarboxylase alpha subunit
LRTGSILPLPGLQSRKLAELVASGSLKIGAIHTYLELYARMLVDLTPRVALVVADQADRHGNLYTGPNTEDTPIIAEAAAFRGGVVVAQVNEIVDHLPRVDIPGDWVDVVVQSPAHYAIEPLFTRDPAKVREDKILMAMMAIAAVYQPYQIRRLNHGIGYATAAIELILPTFGAARGLKGNVATHFVLNPHPTLIPAIEAGFVESVYCFGSELGDGTLCFERADVFPVGADGNLRSNRALAQVAGQYACDLFVGATLQIDAQGNSSTATKGRIAGFGGAPNMGADARGRRHTSPAWLQRGAAGGRRCKGPQACLADGEYPPADGEAELRGAARRDRSRQDSRIRIAAGDDLRRRRHPRHHRTRASQTSCSAVRPGNVKARCAPSPATPILAKGSQPDMTATCADVASSCGRPTSASTSKDAKRDLLAAQTIDDLVAASGGLYAPPAKFRTRAEAPRAEGPAASSPKQQESEMTANLVEARLQRSNASGPRNESEMRTAAADQLNRAETLAKSLLSQRGEASGAAIARELHDVLRKLAAEDRLDFQRFLATGLCAGRNNASRSGGDLSIAPFG